jgi:ubiquinone biosynthesis UbiH/UbiF/VisC/COQ6 family hydroxylase
MQEGAGDRRHFSQWHRFFGFKMAKRLGRAVWAGLAMLIFLGGVVRMGSKGFDVCVSGSGAVAMSLVLALSAEGWQVAWARAPQPATAPQADVRTYALNARAIALLERLRIWPALREWSSPVLEMDVRGDRGGALSFSAWQQCVSELAWIVDAAALERLLGEALRYAPRVEVVPPLTEHGAPVQAALLAVCEGKHSGTRAGLGVEFTRKDYGHWGVAARLKASRPHQGVARQWFRSPDIVALLPFNQPEPHASYGLVWSAPQARAEQLMAMSPTDFEQALQDAIAQSDASAPDKLGQLSLSSPVAAWPLALAKAQRWIGPGWVLLGDAAHQVHPLSGQGLNLGLADVDTLVSVLLEARAKEPWRTPGDERTLRRYERQRAWPTRAMAGVTDGLLTLFADERSPLKDVRNLGMSMVQRMGPLKSWLIGRALDA